MRDTTVGELPAPLVASFAEISFIIAGRTRWTAALLHRALEVEPWDGRALESLSGFLDDGGLGKFPSGFKQLSAVVLERALAAGSPLREEERRRLDDARFIAQWSWGFARHRSGATTLAPETFRDRAAFVVDEARYRDWVHAAGDDAFSAAMPVPGFLAGFLVKRGDDVSKVCGAIRRSDLVIDEGAYAEWKAQPASALDGIQKAFDAAKKR